VVMAQGGWSQSRRSLSQGHHPHKQRQRRRERGKGQPVDYWKLGLGVAVIAGAFVGGCATVSECRSAMHMSIAEHVVGVPIQSVS
jgi:hypothetical protein